MFPNKGLAAVLIGSLLWLASPVWAKGLSQSFVDVGYWTADTDFGDLDGGLVNAAFGVHEFVSLRGRFIRARTDDFKPANDSPDFTEFQFGLRPHWSFSDNGDLFVETLYAINKFNGNNYDRSEKAWIYAGGIRYRLFKRAELLLAGEYRSGQIDEGFVVVGPVFKMTKRVSLSLRTSQSSDDKDYFGGIRIDF